MATTLVREFNQRGATALSRTAVDHCPICDARERIVLFKGRDRLHGVAGRFTVARCADCGSAYLTQQPADPTQYYPATSYAAFDGVTSTRHFSRAPGRSRGLTMWYRLLESIKPDGGRLLDVGCGGVCRTTGGKGH